MMAQKTGLTENGGVVDSSLTVGVCGFSFSGKAQTKAKLTKSSSSVPMRASPARIAGMSHKRFAELCAIGEDSQIDYRVLLDTICRETSRHLDVLGREIRENKNVFEASRYLRWLEFSGVLKLLEKYCLPGQDFSLLRKKVGDSVNDNYNSPLATAGIPHGT